DQFQVGLEDLTEGQGNLLKEDQAVEDSVISAGSYGVEVVPMVGRVRGEVAQVNVPEPRVFLAGQLEVMGSQAVPKAPTAGVGLDEQRTGFLATLQLDKMIAATEGA